MQISTRLLFDRATAQLANAQTDLAKSQAQIAIGKKVINPSDAPEQTAAIARLNSVIDRQASHLDALESVQTRFNHQDSTLGNASEVMIRIKELAIQASNPTHDGQSRTIIATEMRGLRDHLLSLANSQDNNGNFIFSGTRVNTPSFAANAQGRVVYQGDQGQMRVAIGDHQRSLAFNQPGNQVFSRVVRNNNNVQTGVGFFEALDDLVEGVASSNTTAMQQGIAEVDLLHQSLVLAQAYTGTNMVVVAQQRTALEDTQLALQSALSNLQDLDYASAISQIQKKLLALEAAQTSFAKISQLSLFNYLR